MTVHENILSVNDGSVCNHEFDQSKALISVEQNVTEYSARSKINTNSADNGLTRIS